MLAVVAVILSWAGATEPRADWTADEGLSYRDEAGRLVTSMTLEVWNEGPVPFTITGIALDVPGLRLLPPDGTKRERASVRVAAYELVSISRSVHVGDCAKVPREPQPVRFTYRTPLWSGESEAVPDSWRYSGLGDDVTLAWQRGLAAQACNEAVSDEWS
ncbi:hypothetical protein ABZW11_06310 [Nonomuraea sp. NPDC004580]|uniref:hypothetical protein n=1 Tax=Nonomuraea sp. NPDC004580 TaxID=3154552 RepID=UPI0033BCDA11